MGQKKVQSDNAAARAVRQRREEQQRKDRRNLFLIVGAVIAVLVILAVLVAWALGSGGSSDEGSKDFTISPSVSKERGFVLGKDGPGKATKGAPVVEMYYDYSCAHCVDFEHRAGEDVEADVEAGKYTLILHPVLTEALSYQYPATELAIRVYQDQPDKFFAVHNALAEKAYQLMVKRDIASLTKDPVATVQEVGRQVGVRKAILDSLSPSATQAELSTWSQAWLKTGLAPDDRYGTPMFVRDGKQLEIQTIDQALGKMRGQ